ncbi:NUDIX hydrolase [Derxia lacustris]|uniref:NUDIX hydrolase n=1 Tax=Derxia lacustris TaxID=764842 RepID=UPI00159385FE|nr:NUDIX domain-containing protein [Derxia lacustris]
MIHFTTQGITFQLRAAAILVNRDRVLLHRALGDDFWTLPGGRVEPGEDSEAALRRELLEELGATVGAARLVHVVEGFFDTAAGPLHELALHYLVPLADDSALAMQTGPFAGIETDKRLEFRWFALDGLAGENVWPLLLRQGRAALGDGVLHAVERAG